MAARALVPLVPGEALPEMFKSLLETLPKDSHQRYETVDLVSFQHLRYSFWPTGILTSYISYYIGFVKTKSMAVYFRSV